MLRKMRALKITRQKDDPISSKRRTFSSKPSSPQLTKREKSRTQKTKYSLLVRKKP
jgi:hypothetical protein